MPAGAAPPRRLARSQRAVAFVIAALAITLLPAASAHARSTGHPGHFAGVVTAANAAGQGLHGRLFTGAPVGAAGANNLAYHGGPVIHSDANYSIYWEPSGHSTASSYKSLIDGYFSNVGAASGATSNDYSVATQYSDGSGPIAYQASFGARVVDTNPYPPSGCPASGSQPCLTDAQLATELSRVISVQGLPRNLQTIYYIFTPPGVATCCFDSAGSDCSSGGLTFDYCAYHSWSSDRSTLYAVMPYANVSGCRSGEAPNGDAADSTLNVTSHENIEAITDPLGSAWFDSQGAEIGDKCAWNFGGLLGGSSWAYYNELISTGKYWLQQEWSNASGGCVQRMASSSHPVASFTFSPSAPTVAQSVSFSGSGSTDSGGTITSYAWTFGDGATGSGVSATHAYASTGTYTVTLKITDSTGQTSTATHSVTVSTSSGGSPVASFTFSPGAPAVGQSVSFNGSGSTDSGATITSYAWTFGDAATGSGVSATHAYAAAGTYTVTLKIADSSGKTSTTSHTVTVGAGNPVAAFTFSPSSPGVGQAVTFNGSGSASPNGSIVSYAWTFGDGATATGVSPSHAYSAGGSYTVALTVTDSANRTSTVSQTVSVSGGGNQ